MLGREKRVSCFGHFLVILSFQLILANSVFCHQVSFYGDSFLRLPVNHASPSNEIELHFYTARQDGLLLLVAGTTDFFRVELRAGMVQSRLELGGGPALVASPPGVSFSDLRWHHVHLIHSGNLLRMTIDGMYSSEVHVPGKFVELNIDNFVFIGGGSTFDDDSLYFGNVLDFRGCIANATFNSLDLFQVTKERLHPHTEDDSIVAHAVTWNCAEEFSAASTLPIRFIDHGASFIAFQSLGNRQDVTLLLSVRTRSSQALLVFCSGGTPRSDYLAVRLIGGKVTLHINKGSGTFVLNSPVPINDGTWHQMVLHIDRTSGRLIVDGRRIENETRFSENNRLLDLTMPLFVGGVDARTRQEILHRSQPSRLLNSFRVTESLVGCVAGFRVDGRFFGFHEAVTSRGILPDCQRQLPCRSHPCPPNTTCPEDDLDTFTCTDRNTIAPSSPVPHLSLGTSRDLMTGTPLLVLEGERALITQQMLKVNKAPGSDKIHNDNTFFRIIKAPTHGKVIKENYGSNETIFSLSDVLNSKVLYEHDGSEGTEDNLRIELQLAANNNRSSSGTDFRFKREFTLPIKVVPVNDRPRIELRENGNLILVVNTHLKVTPSILSAFDPDDSPSVLEYSVQQQQSGADVGYFEILKSNGVRARTLRFTQDDINRGRLDYIHRGVLNQRVHFVVSDGRDSSDQQVLKIVAVPLLLNPDANAGSIVPRAGSVLITRSNLTFSTNAPNQDIEIRYFVTDPPYEGEIQQEQYGDGQWVVVSTFTQKQIDKNRIRYRHYNDSDVRGDYFRFKVSAMDVETQEFEFHVSVIETRVELVRNKMLVLRGTREKPITWDELKSVSTLPYHGPSDVVYRLKTIPANGFLYRTYPGTTTEGAKGRKKRLGIGSSVTQAEINDGRIVYRLKRALHSLVDDEFEFEVIVAGVLPIAQNFHVTYEPIVGKLRFINNGLTDVGEGLNATITSEDLFVEMNGFRNFRYQVIEFPRHGTLRIVNPRTDSVLKPNVSSFTNEDISSDRVQYLHDDSESEEDFFGFVVTSVPDERGGTSYIPHEVGNYSAIFEIGILLKNDNAPQRTVDKVFHVATGRGRPLTPDDLFYVDPDVNFDTSRLEYTWQTILNGLIVLKANHSVVMYRFIQRDIMDGILYIQHKGASYGKSVIWVSDGKYISTGLLEIQASDPFVRLENSGALVVERGKSAPITRKNLAVMTNVDAAKENITVHLTESPREGVLTVKGKPATRFTLADLESREVRYSHQGDDRHKDALKFQVSAITCHADGVIPIQIVSVQLFHSSLEIVSNKGATVHEKDTFTFSGHHLNITCNHHCHPTDIRYDVISPATYGRLLMKTMEEKPVETFTQNDINNELVAYEHLESTEFEDRIGFNVTLNITTSSYSGGDSLSNLTFILRIIPATIPLEVSDIVVKEGDRVYLSKDRLTIQNRYYESQDVELVVVKDPTNGRIEYDDSPGQKRTHFTYAQVQAWAIAYSHDGSNATTDKFSLIARLKGYPGVQSDPKAIEVRVVTKNDQMPRIFINRPLAVWTGSVTVITKEHLSVDDPDSTAEEIEFIITTPSEEGRLALSDKSVEPITNFTQAHINKGQIVFIHTGGTENVIKFDITDGVHVVRDQTFLITAKKLEISLKKKSTTLELFPGLIQPITRLHLGASMDESNYPWPITFSVISKPRKGKILRLQPITEFTEVDSFTHDDVDNMKIFYSFTSSMSNWTEEDVFSVKILSEYDATIDNQTVSVEIGFRHINEENSRYLISESIVTVPEGGQVHLSKTYLDCARLKKALSDYGMKNIDIYYVLEDVPRHGTLDIRGRNATRDDRFTQRDINKGYVTYVHDNSETISDLSSYRVEIDLVSSFDNAGGKNQLVPKFRGFINFTILPINDQPFLLVTRNPSIEIVQGSTCNITRRELQTIDADSSPADIRYEITIPPKNGILAKSNDSTTSIGSFTQEEVDNRLVRFIHDGSTRSGVFFFQVTDGGFLPLNKAFNIYVHPLRLEMGNGSEVIVSQGDIAVALNATHVPLITNGERNAVKYNISKIPNYGRLYVGDAPVLNFTQTDLDRSDVFYIQNDIRHPTDSFDIVAYDSHNVLSARRIQILVKARVRKDEPLIVTSGEEGTKISLDNLDASELALVTGNNPTFYVLKEPVFGQLIVAERSQRKGELGISVRKDKRRVRNRNSTSVQREPSYMRNAVYVFTHDDIVQERVEYRPLQYSISTKKADSISYVLHATNAQPATDTLRITVNPVAVHSTPVLETKPVPEATMSTSLSAKVQVNKRLELEAAMAADASTSGDNTQLHLLIVLLVSGLTVAIIVIIVTTRCYSAYKKRRRYKIADAVAQDALIFKDLPLSLGNVCQPPLPSDDFDFSEPPSSQISFVLPTRRSRPRPGKGNPGTGKMKLGVAFAEPVGSEWDNVDPEIVQHCRKSNPLLHEEKLWV